MVRVLAVTVALLVVAPASSALPGKPRPPAPASSFAPRPSSGPHVYGSPLGAPIARGAIVKRNHASPKHPAKSAPNHAPSAKHQKPAPPIYTQPVQN